MQSIWTDETIHFSGYDWQIKNGYYYPGENSWDKRNVWVDENGCLHMKITWRNGRWHCAEIASKQVFGYGLFRFRISGRVDNMDAQKVAGLFVYPGPDLPFRENQEIDIEFSRWGQINEHVGNYTVTPNTQSFPVLLQGDYSTHQFLWLPDKVLFSSFHGHDKAVISSQSHIADWTFEPSYEREMPVPPLKVHINFWLYEGKPPQEGSESEFIVRDFLFIPFSASGFKIGAILL